MLRRPHLTKQRIKYRCHLYFWLGARPSLSMNNELTYIETFDESCGGWIGSNGNSIGNSPLIRRAGALHTHSPWWVDYNHAPPGLGYLHILFTLHTKGPFGEHLKEVGGVNRFVDEGFPRDFRGATIRARMKGEIELRGSRLHLLVQSKIEDVTASWLLMSSTFEVTPDWTEQSVILEDNETAWSWLGVRHDRKDFYGIKPLGHVLADVNTNILLVLFPLDVVPMGPLCGDPHQLRAGKDYPLWTSRLPEGYVDLDEVRIHFPGKDTGS